MSISDFDSALKKTEDIRDNILTQVFEAYRQQPIKPEAYKKRGGPRESSTVMAGKGNVTYQSPGSLVRVVCGDGDLIPSEPQPSTDAEYIGRVGVNIGDGGLGQHGEFCEQWVKFSDGTQKAFKGWQLEWVYSELNLERIRIDYKIAPDRFADLVLEWLNAYRSHVNDTRD